MRKLLILSIFFLLIHFSNAQCTGSFIYTDTCFSNATQFHAIVTGGSLVGDSTLWKWNFGDPSSGSKDSAKGPSPTHLYTSQGTYNVRLVFPCGATTDTVKQVINITNPLSISVDIKDSLVCDTPYVLDAGINGLKYLWSNGDTTQQSTISSAGHYWIKTFKDGCYATDTANIRFWGKGNKGDYIWMFGDKSGLDFKDTPPSQISTSKDSTFGATSVISDPSGKLLFYTNGTTIYNNKNSIMQGGTGLLSEDSLQSVLIVPDPRANNIYYVFSSSPTNGITYSVVDLSFNNGDGKVTELNVPIATPGNALVTGQIAGTKDSTGNNFWTIVHGLNSNEFFAYNIGNAGLNINPVISNAGSIVATEGGNLKFSKDGSRAALTIPGKNQVELFDFNKATGKFTLTDTITNLISPYDVAFSDDNSKLYISTDGDGHLYQYQLGAANDSLLMASRSTIGTNPGTGIYGLQAAPDSKIYVSIPGSTSLGVINNPEQDSTGTDFQITGQAISGRAGGGLTNFIANYFNTTSWAISVGDGCLGTASQFSATAPDTITSWSWDFGDGSTASGQFVTHTYGSIGTFNVSVRAKYGNCIDTTMSETVTIVQTPSVTLQDATVCDNGSFTLDATFPGASYQWSTGASTPTITTDTSGFFQVVVSIGSCAVLAQANVTFSPVATFNLGPDVTLCNGDSLKLDADNTGLTYLWSTGATTQTIVVRNSNTYSVVVSNGPTCKKSDNITVSFINPPTISLGAANQVVCPNNPGFTNPILDAGFYSGFQYIWSTNETTQQIQISSSGTYGVQVFRDKCISGDTVTVTFDNGPSVSLPPELVFCSDFVDTLVLDGGIADHYLWIPGNVTSQTLIVKSAGLYSLTASDVNNCQAVKVSTEVKDICEAQLFVPTIFSPNGDGQNDVFKVYGNHITSYQLEIFNRWGELIFVSKDINISWDGNYRGQLVEEDVYVWKISYSGETTNGIKSKVKTGDVTVIKSQN